MVAGSYAVVQGSAGKFGIADNREALGDAVVVPGVPVGCYGSETCAPLCERVPEPVVVRLGR